MNFPDLAAWSSIFKSKWEARVHERRSDTPGRSCSSSWYLCFLPSYFLISSHCGAKGISLLSFPTKSEPLLFLAACTSRKSAGQAAGKPGWRPRRRRSHRGGSRTFAPLEGWLMTRGLLRVVAETARENVWPLLLDEQRSPWPWQRAVTHSLAGMNCFWTVPLTSEAQTGLFSHLSGIRGKSGLTQLRPENGLE